MCLFPQHLLTEEEKNTAYKCLELGSSSLSRISMNNFFETVFSLPNFYWYMAGFPPSSFSLRWS